jgi:acyl-CoA reductase-like NAD-dependent aldehyde dehydrogenase
MVRRARGAQPEWAALPFAQRAELIRQAGREILDHAAQTAELIQAEMGKLSRHARQEVEWFAKGFERQIANFEAALKPDELPFDGGVTRVHYVPLGVAAVITPWNFPAGMPLSLAVPALLAGNTVVAKPSEYSTRTGLAVLEALRRRVPQDALQIVVGDDEQGRAMVESEVDLIAFIGSREVGKQIMQTASRRACRVILEMGGKCAMVVARDADLAQAARFAARGAFRNTGQVCCAVERIYVERDAAPAFAEAIRAAAREAAVGEDNGTDMCMGPFCNSTQMEHVEELVKDAVGNGANLVQGGRRLDRPGFWFEPTILTGLRSDMAIMQKETFGPVACVQSVESVEEGIRLANATRYGLTATIWSKDEEAARRLALRLEAGCVGVNRSFGGHPDAPWAGAKESGFGHTGGVSGARQFLQPRSITV